MFPQLPVVVARRPSPFTSRAAVVLLLAVGLLVPLGRGDAAEIDLEILVSRGDVNSDGKVDVYDAVLLSRWLFQGAETSPLPPSVADTDGDGLVGPEDLVVLLSIAMGMTPVGESEVPTTGKDVPTAGDIPERDLIYLLPAAYAEVADGATHIEDLLKKRKKIRAAKLTLSAADYVPGGSEVLPFRAVDLEECLEGWLPADEGDEWVLVHVVKDSSTEHNADKEYVLQRLEGRNDLSEALAEHLQQLGDDVVIVVVDDHDDDDEDD